MVKNIMKTKITVGFVVISALFLFLVLKGGYFKSSGQSGANQKQLTKSQILNKLSEIEILSYSGDKIIFDKDKYLATDKIVIHLWASWCGPCVNEVPDLISYSQKNPDVKFIIVSLDDGKEDIVKFLKSFPEFNSDNYFKIWDASKQLSYFLNADRLPMSVIMSPSKSEPQFILSVVHWNNIEI